MKNRLIKTLSASGFGQLVTLVSQFVFVPVFIKILGIDLYGEWLILFSIPLYISMADLGFSEYFNNRSSLDYADGDSSKALVFLNTGFFGTIFLSLIFVFAVVASFHLGDFYSLFNLAIMSERDAFFIFALLSMYSMMCCVSTYLSSSFRVERNYSKGIFLVNVVRVVEFIGCLLAIYLTGSLVIVSLAFLAIRFLGCIFIYFELIRTSNFINFLLRYADFSIFKSSLKESLYFSLFPVSLIASANGISTVIGIFLGPREVVIFNCLRTVSRVPFQIVNIINSSIWQEVTYLFSKSHFSKDTFDSLLFKSIGASFIISLLMSVFLFLSIDVILEYWTDSTVKSNNDLFLYMLVAICLNSIWFSASVYLRASNNHKKLFSVYFFLVAALLLSIGFTIEEYEFLSIGLLLVTLEILMCVFTLFQVIKLRAKYRSAI